MIAALFCGCSSSQSDDEALGAEPQRALSGTWVVGGIYLDGKLIDVNDAEGIASIYGNQLITFDEEGNFSYLNLFLTEGSYSKIFRKDYKMTYLLKSENFFRYDNDAEEFVEQPFYQGIKTQYIISLLDENTLAMWVYDESTDTLKDESEPILYVRNGSTSSYINKYKTDINDW
ncbi:MAG: hypothetical protein J6L81_00145 [Clostridia bacterium]|nr:hypothetical protein [Clostridia bacterium]